MAANEVSPLPPGDMRGWPKTTVAQLQAGVDDEGLAEDTTKETRVLYSRGVAITAGGVCRMFATDGDRDVEIRFRVSSLVKVGWTPPDCGRRRIGGCLGVVGGVY